MGGAVLDVVVDLEVGSPSFQALANCSARQRRLSRASYSDGRGHAFVALSEQATVVYLCSTPYAP
ncbi:MAG: dTDP-4-dehydrorhamnose 3,5-epimerase family protein [Streptosporangiaceae bacterium]